jgi:hypothetical protein
MNIGSSSGNLLLRWLDNFTPFIISPGGLKSEVQHLSRVFSVVHNPFGGNRMPRITRLCTLTLGIALVGSVHAYGPGWTPTSTIRQLVVTASGGVNVRLTPDLTTCVSQSGYGENYASIYPTHPGIKLLKADLLAAYLAGKTVRLYLSDSNCQVAEAIVGD